MRKGEVEPFHTDTLLALREVHMLTSMRGGRIEDTGKVNRGTGTLQKMPSCILEYS